MYVRSSFVRIYNVKDAQRFSCASKEALPNGHLRNINFIYLVEMEVICNYCNS